MDQIRDFFRSEKVLPRANLTHFGSKYRITIKILNRYQTSDPWLLSLSVQAKDVDSPVAGAVRPAHVRGERAQAGDTRL